MTQAPDVIQIYGELPEKCCSHCFHFEPLAAQELLPSGWISRRGICEKSPEKKIVGATWEMECFCSRG